MSIILFSVLALFTPLLFGTPTYENFELPKMFFVYVLGGTILWVFLIERILPGKTEKLILPSREILLFVSFYGISTALSIHKYTSVWGYYKRFNGGLISLLVFAGLFLVLINRFRRKQIREFINYTALAGIPISVFAIYQHYGPDPVVRAFSTFGQANWLAAFLVMTGLIALTNSMSAKTRGEGWFWSAGFVLSFWGMWVTYSVSGVLGFTVGLIYFLILYKNLVKEKSKHLALLFVLIFAIVISSPGIFNDKIRDIFIDLKKVYAQDEPLENAISDPGYIRTELWAGTLKLWASSPKNILFGTGPETFPYAFQEFRPLSLNYSSEWDFVFNKPHNYYLELLSTIGLFGTAAYLFIIKKTLNAQNKAYAPALLALYVTNIFGWPTVSTALLFWLILAENQK